MRVIHVARKPVEGTVAKNALKYGTGGIYIDGTRIGHTEDFSGVQGFASMKLNARRQGESYEDWQTRVKGGPEQQASLAKLQNLGRWPSNVIFQHLPMCRQDGTETVANWVCSEGCPVAALDNKVGLLKSGSVKPDYQKNSTSQPSDGGYHGRYGDTPLTSFGGEGGASRFFKQVKP